MAHLDPQNKTFLGGNPTYPHNIIISAKYMKEIHIQNANIHEV